MQGTSRFLRVLLRSKSGFTLVEALLVTGIMGIIMAGLFYVLSTGELSSVISYSRVEAQSSARRVVDWVTRDARLARVYDIGSLASNPTNSHLKFYPVTGWDAVNKQYTLSPNYIEYTYDSNTKTLKRETIDSSGNVVNTWLFQDIVSPPFFTFDTAGNIIDLGTEIHQSRMLIVSINVRKQARGGVNIDAGITTEVRIRNG